MCNLDNNKSALDYGALLLHAKILILHASLAVILGPQVLEISHPYITSELWMGCPIMPGCLGIPCRPQSVRDLGTP